MRQEFFNKKNIDLDLYMVNCGYEDCCPKFTCPPHIRDYYLVHYITAGSGYYEVAGQKFFLEKGDAFFIYPGEIVTYYSPDINNTWSFCWIGFAGSAAKQYLRYAHIDSHAYTWTLHNLNFYSAIRNCLDYLNRNGNVASQITLNTFLLSCFKAFSDAPYKSRSEKPVNQVDKAIRYIEYNYMKHITVASIAQFLSLDRTYFYRIFKKYTGSSPQDYIANYRIKKSIELIEGSRLSIGEAAASVGIHDIYYFSKLFKKVTGLSPSQYKKNG